MIRRRNAASLKPLRPTGPWDPILEWYAKAIREMRRRPIVNPASWRYQAAIHAYNRARDPFAVAGETLPSATEQGRFWGRCQHASWFFLPWHRMYLGYFEQTVQATITALGGPSDWALPYWNYRTDNDDSRRLPLAFTLPTMPNGDSNPLRNERRLRGNDGGIVATANQAAVRTALIDPDFSEPPAFGLAGFGGPVTGFNHGGTPGAPMGKLEGTPHGSMHGAVGDFMGAFNTAGLDPIFWLHHANIDRLWAVWRNRNPLHLDPTAAQWLTGVTFFFHDGAGNEVSHTAADVVDTTSDLFNYEYDDVNDPVGGARAVAPAAEERRMPQQPETVGASDAPVVLTGGAATTRVTMSAPAGPAAARAAAAEPPRVHVNIENVTGLESDASYAVYLNVPEGEKPEEHPDLFAGLVPMFGVAEATRGDAGRAGDGLTFSLDVTEVVGRLDARGAWTSEVDVTFVPEGMPVTQPRAAAEAPPEPITVGRISVIFS